MNYKYFLIFFLVLTLIHPIFLGEVTDMPIRGTNLILAQGKDELAISETIESKQLDPRAEILAAYLTEYNSPLAYHAQDFIDAADEYGVDWKLVPSIAGVESTFGKQIPGGYNAWGWGVYGNQSLGFKSWRDGIFTVTGGLRKNYIDKGLTEPLAMNRVYASSKAWGGHVIFFMNDLDKFAKSYPISATVEVADSEAGTSAELIIK